jgi:hypothetical protein
MVFNPAVRPSLSNLMHQQEMHKKMITNGLLSSCINCMHWSGMKTEMCEKFKTRPPLTVIVYGCPEWEHEIPF